MQAQPMVNANVEGFDFGMPPNWTLSMPNYECGSLMNFFSVLKPAL